MNNAKNVDILSKLLCNSITKLTSITGLAMLMSACGVTVNEENLILDPVQSKTVEYFVNKKEKWLKTLYFDESGDIMYVYTTDHHGNSYYDDKDLKITFSDQLTLELMQTIHGKGHVTKLGKITEKPLKTETEEKINEEGKAEDEKKQD